MNLSYIGQTPILIFGKVSGPDSLGGYVVLKQQLRQKIGYASYLTKNDFPNLKCVRAAFRTFRASLMGKVKFVPICHICGTKLDTTTANKANSFTLDHVIPISKGGRIFDINNLKPCCKKCNSLKQNETM